jgi:hypothetical protein
MNLLLLAVGINPDTSVLRCFPHGYQLYTHVKGPPGDERYDNYLMGRYIRPHVEVLSLTHLL